MKVWVIQRNAHGTPEYLCVGTWISAPDTIDQATRFGRREDAWNIIDLIRGFQIDLPFRATLEGFRPNESRPFPTEIEVER